MIYVNMSASKSPAGSDRCEKIQVPHYLTFASYNTAAQEDCAAFHTELLPLLSQPPPFISVWIGCSATFSPNFSSREASS